MTAFFGPAGNCTDFSNKYKSSIKAPAYLAEMGLNAYEYQCGRGVNVGEAAARALGEQARLEGIKISLHSPYFINLSSPEGERVSKSINYIVESCRAVDWMGGERVVVHCGGLTGQTRREAMENTLSTLRLTLAELEVRGLAHVTLCIETMGKINVLGDLSEVIEICRLDERLLPCIDFGHLNARTQGGLNEHEKFVALFDALEQGIGLERTSRFHAHFSKIEYTKMGEKKHLTFEDTVFGPDFDPVARLVAQRGYAPTIICESAGTQAEDALIMKNMYLAQL